MMEKKLQWGRVSSLSVSFLEKTLRHVKIIFYGERGY
jgi:hypothetical protein